MAGRLEALFSSLSVRLLAGLIATIVVLLSLYTAVSVRTFEKQWLEVVLGCANRTSQLVQGASRYGMLLNRKDDVHSTIREIARSPGVAGIRIYDKNGQIIFSNDERQIGQTVDLQAEACVVCHAAGVPLQAVPGPDRTRIFRGADGTRILGVINPILNEPDCSSAACHAHPAGQTVLGVLDVQMSAASMEETLAQTRRTMIWATALLILSVAGVSGLFVNRFVRKPVAKLHAGTRRVASGDLDVELEVTRADELGELARAFNHMTADLKRARNELTGWSEKLEQKVVEKTEELGRVQRQIVQMEKMASLGKLAATVAHELNNPLAGILTYAKLVKREIDADTLSDEGRADTLRYLDLIAKESGRCGAIVKNLLLFSRRSGVDFAPTHLNELVERATMLVRHHTEMASVSLEKLLLASDDVVVCDPDQIQQALVALLVNAVEAMSGMGGGTVTVRLVAVGESIDVEVQDTGVGILPETLPHIFEPFFSTKDNESGVGLGLAVVYGIMQRHGATIDVVSQVGQGTTFRIRLPRRPQAQSASPAADAQR